MSVGEVHCVKREGGGGARTKKAKKGGKEGGSKWEVRGVGMSE